MNREKKSPIVTLIPKTRFLEKDLVYMILEHEYEEGGGFSVSDSFYITLQTKRENISMRVNQFLIPYRKEIESSGLSLGGLRENIESSIIGGQNYSVNSNNLSLKSYVIGKVDKLEVI